MWGWVVNDMYYQLGKDHAPLILFLFCLALIFQVLIFVVIGLVGVGLGVLTAKLLLRFLPPQVPLIRWLLWLPITGCYLLGCFYVVGSSTPEAPKVNQIQLQVEQLPSNKQRVTVTWSGLPVTGQKLFDGRHFLGTCRVQVCTVVLPRTVRFLRLEWISKDQKQVQTINLS